MANTEEIGKKNRQIVILKQFIETLREEINTLKKPEDPHAELKAAHAAGKRIAFRTRIGAYACFDEWEFLTTPKILWASNNPSYYKIVEDDKTYTAIYDVLGFIGENVKTKFTKCSLTGNITAEVVE